MPPGGAQVTSTTGRGAGAGYVKTQAPGHRPLGAGPAGSLGGLVGPAGQLVAPETRPLWAWYRDSLSHLASQLAAASRPPQPSGPPGLLHLLEAPRVDLQQTPATLLAIWAESITPQHHCPGENLPTADRVHGSTQAPGMAPTQGAPPDTRSPAPRPGLARSPRLRAHPSSTLPAPATDIASPRTQVPRGLARPRQSRARQSLVHWGLPRMPALDPDHPRDPTPHEPCPRSPWKCGKDIP